MLGSVTWAAWRVGTINVRKLGAEALRMPGGNRRHAVGTVTIPCAIGEPAVPQPRIQPPSVALLRPAGIFRVPWPSPLFRCSARTRATLHSMLEDSPHTRLLS